MRTKSEEFRSIFFPAVRYLFRFCMVGFPLAVLVLLRFISLQESTLLYTFEVSFSVSAILSTAGGLSYILKLRREGHASPIVYAHRPISSTALFILAFLTPATIREATLGDTQE